MLGEALAEDATGSAQLCELLNRGKGVRILACGNKGLEEDAARIRLADLGQDVLLGINDDVLIVHNVIRL